MSSLENKNRTRVENTSNDRIIQSIYDHIVQSVCVSVAGTMHELIKTGGMSSSFLKGPISRHEIYPELYDPEETSEEQINELLDKYATERASTSNGTTSRKRKLAQNQSSSTDDVTPTKKKGIDDEDDDDDDDDSDEDFQDPEEQKERALAPTTAATTTSSPTSTKPSTSHLDIWGNMPPKEPKQTCLCQLCGRHVSASRFAQHLDKCMGLSTARGASATGTLSRSSTLGSVHSYTGTGIIK